VIGRLLRRQTLSSFDYQWRELPEGEALLSDEWFLENVERILSAELLALDPDWFRGKRVLDAGAGMGRWTVGLLRLGAHVTAVDASEHALQRLRENVEALCSPDEQRRLQTAVVDLLHPPPALAQEKFDLVFSFGVLHHTGDTRRALAGLTPIVADGGALFLYLYGEESMSRRTRATVSVARLALAVLPYRAKRRVIAAVFRRSDPHAMFDLLSPTINTRHTLAEVRRWLAELGFASVEQTIRHSELFLRATRAADDLQAFVTPLPHPPYWFERYGKGLGATETGSNTPREVSDLAELDRAQHAQRPEQEEKRERRP
jgi:SAM-dependent methyltransferase